MINAGLRARASSYRLGKSEIKGWHQHRTASAIEEVATVTASYCTVFTRTVYIYALRISISYLDIIHTCSELIISLWTISCLAPSLLQTNDSIYPNSHPLRPRPLVRHHLLVRGWISNTIV